MECVRAIEFSKSKKFVIDLKLNGIEIFLAHHLYGDRCFCKVTKPVVINLLVALRCKPKHVNCCGSLDEKLHFKCIITRVTQAQSLNRSFGRL